MDASCKIQRSIHDVRLTYKYVSRILGTYHLAVRLFFFVKSCKQDLQLLPLGGRRSLIFEDDFENYAHNTDYCRKAELLPCRFYSLERMVTLLPCTH